MTGLHRVPRPSPGPRSLPGVRASGTLLFSILGPVLIPHLVAQEPADARLSGEVVKDGAPLDEGTVVLHRVTQADAGEVDSVRLRGDGRFEFVLPDPPAAGAPPDPEGRSDVYFASIRHQGIFYFGPAVTRPAQLDSLYRIEVHDTVGAPPGGAELPVSHRTVLLEEAEGAWRVTDLFELRNEGGGTVVAPGGGATWRYPLPEEGREFRTGQGDFPPDAVAFGDGEVRVSAPLPPGRRVFVVRYVVPSLDLTLPLPGTTDVMELLIREPAPPVEVPGLVAAPPVELEPGSTYRTFSGEGLRDTRIRIRPSREDAAFPVEWVAVILALVLGVAGLVAVGMRRGRPDTEAVEAVPGAGPPGDAAARSSEEPTREELVVEIARLDEEFEAKADPTPAEEARYRARRGRLLEQLASRG